METRHRTTTRQPVFAPISNLPTCIRPLLLGIVAWTWWGSTAAATQASFAQLPLSFEFNQGQASQDIRYLARGPGYAVSLTQTAATLALSKSGAAGETSRLIRMSLPGANPKPQLIGLARLPGKVNYIVGRDPVGWQTQVPLYARVEYRQVYPGVDLVYYGNPRQLEYDFVVAPGVDPNIITLRFQGADNLELEHGEALLRTGQGDLHLRAPQVYQVRDGVRTPIAARYVRKSRDRLGFQLAAYDKARPLVIDPVLSYSTYLGASDIDSISAIALDSAGSVYVTGTTRSTAFLVTPGAAQVAFGGGSWDAFVAKLNPAGTALEYATYLGGNDFDGGRGIAVDNAGNAYVVGSTTSSTFPTTAGAVQTASGGGEDAFVAKLNASGTGLVYASYLGGGTEDQGFAIALDSSGNAYVTGQTTSSDFPVSAGAFRTTLSGPYDAYVTKLSGNGSELVYSTYLGGGKFDAGDAIAVDGSGSAYVAGETLSDDFPVSAGALQSQHMGKRDAFVAKLRADGAALGFASYHGGSDDDYGLGIALNGTGNVFMTGQTTSMDFPVTAGAIQTVFGGVEDGFVSKFNATGTALAFSTYLGGTLHDEAYGIAVDAAGGVYVTGQTASTDFPRSSDAVQNTRSGFQDAFVARLNGTGTDLSFSSYLGGSGEDAANGIAVDVSGNAYVAGSTTSADFPTTPGAFQSTYGGGDSDAFLAKLSIVEPPEILSFTATSTQGGVIVAGVPVAFAVTVAAPGKVQSVQWDFDGNGTVDQTTAALGTQSAYPAAGTYTAKVTVVDADGGKASRTTAVNVLSPAQAVATASVLASQLPLNAGQRNSLISKLNAVVAALGRGDTAAACRVLGAEFHEIDALVQSGQLDAIAAQPLLDELLAIRGSLGC